MRTFFYIIFFILSLINCFSQEIVFESAIDVNSNSREKIKSYPIVDTINNQLSIFLLDNTKVNWLYFDTNLNLVENSSTNIQDKNFEILLGGNNYKNNYYLYFTNQKKDKIYIQVFDKHSNNSYGVVSSIEFKDYLFLESFNYNNRYYFVTIKKSSSILKLFVFEGNKIQNTKEFDFSEIKFKESVNSKLYAAVNASVSNRPDIQVQKIGYKNPIPINLTCKENKLYQYGDKFYITLDNEYYNTKIIIIDLEDFSSEVKFFEKGKVINKDKFNIRSNSYLHYEHLFQVKNSKQELCFTIHNINNNSLIKEFRVKKGEDIYFSNTPILQDVRTNIASTNKKGEILNTSKLLKNMSSSLAAISVYQLPDILEVTIGGHWEPGQKGQMRYGYSGKPTNPVSPRSMGSIDLGTHNSEMYGFLRYINSQSTYFITLFDPINLEPEQNKNVVINALDKIKNYTEEVKLDIRAETIFKMTNYYIFGYYNKSEGKYYLSRFTD